MSKLISDSTLEDIGRWVEQAQLIASALDAEGEDGSGWLDCLQGTLDIFHLAMCQNCQCCYQRGNEFERLLDSRVCETCGKCLLDRDIDYQETVESARKGSVYSCFNSSEEE